MSSGSSSVLLYMYMYNTSISFLIILNFFPQVAENWKCSSAFHQTVTHLTNLLLEQIVSLEFICFLQTYSQFFPGLISYHLRKGREWNAFWLHVLILYFVLCCSDTGMACMSLDSHWRFMELERIISEFFFFSFFHFLFLWGLLYYSLDGLKLAPSNRFLKGHV